MRHLVLPLLAVTSVAGCAQVPPYDPDSVAAYAPPVFAGDGIYFLSEASRHIIEVIPGPQGEEAYTDQEDVTVTSFDAGGAAQGLRVTPDGGHLLALSHDLADALVVKVPGLPCEGEGDPGCPVRLEARPLHNRLALSPDGRWALSYIDEGSADSSGSTVVNLNEVGIYDLEAGAVRFATLGYGPRAFAFTSDGSRVVVLTASRVAVLTLETGEVTTRELTLDTDERVAPRSVSLTGDDHYALVTVTDSADLFTFDLTQESLPINILALAGAPVTMAPTQDGEATILLEDNGFIAQILRHDDLSLDTVELSAPAGTILVPPGWDRAVLYSTSTTLYMLDIASARATPYLLDQPSFEVYASPSTEALVIAYAPDVYSYESYEGELLYGLAVLNLAQGDRQPNPVLTSTLPLGAAFDGGQVFSMLDEGSQGRLLWMDVSTYASGTAALPPRPTTLGRIPTDGRIVVAHASAGGFLSIVDPAQPDVVQFIHGFMLTDLL